MFDFLMEVMNTSQKAMYGSIWCSSKKTTDCRRSSWNDGIQSRVRSRQLVGILYSNSSLIHKTYDVGHTHMLLGFVIKVREHVGKVFPHSHIVECVFYGDTI